MGALIGKHGFQIHHVSHDGIFSSDAHASMNLASLAGNVNRHFHIISFGHGDVNCLCSAFIHHFTYFPGQKLGLGDFGEHFC